MLIICRGFTSAPTVQARVSHTFVALQSNSTLNFPYNPKLPTGTKIQLVEVSGQLPVPLATNTDYYVVAPTTANGLQIIRLNYQLVLQMQILRLLLHLQVLQ